MNLQNQIDYLKHYLQQDMFDDCFVPAGLDMQRVRGAIVMRCGLMTPIFSEPEVQRAATQQFFFENRWNFEHILKILNAEYSPIENVAEWRDENQTGENIHVKEHEFNDREENSGIDGRTIQESGQDIESESGQTVNAESGTTQNAEGGSTQNTEGGTTVTTYEISAENAETYQADRRENVQHGRTDTATHGKTDTTTHGKTDTTTHGKTDTTEYGKTVQDDLTHGKITERSGGTKITDTDSGDRGLHFFRHGNIGVTTNQDMINQELDLLERFNPYRFIAELYEKEFMLGIY